MRILLSTLILCILHQVAMASPFFVFNHKVFYVPTEGPIVETYIEFHGKSLTMSPNPEGFISGLVEITILFRDGDNVITYDKKIIGTPSMTPDDIIDFLDVQRFKVPYGTYTIEIKLSDLNAPDVQAVEFEMDIEVPQPQTDIFFSDVQLVMGYKKTEEVNMYSKSGFDLLPLVSDDYIGVNVKELMFYAELYNAHTLGNDEKFLLSSYIADARTGDVMPETQKYERKAATEVRPTLTKINIEDLESGDYLVVIEARNRSNEILARVEHPFTRNYKGKEVDLSNLNEDYIAGSWVSLYDDKAELFEYIQSTRPITDESERYAMQNTFEDFFSSDLKQLQHYFFTFWETRSPGNGENKWLAYKEQVEYVQEAFGTGNKRGYDTDRGRVYLQYGPPIDISDRPNEPSSYPYQIWRYYKAGRWNNVRFVFFDPDLTSIDYTLLHCESIPGEIRNPQWRLLLEQRNTPMNNVDRRSGQQHFGGRVDDFFDNPR